MQTIEQLLNNPGQFIRGDGVDYVAMEHEIELLTSTMEFTDAEKRMNWVEQFTRQLDDLISKELHAPKPSKEVEKKETAVSTKKSKVMEAMTEISKGVPFVANEENESAMTEYLVTETDKVSGKVWNGEAQKYCSEKQMPMQIKTAYLRKTGDINVQLSIWDSKAMEDGKICLGQQLDYFDRSVHDAVVSLLLVGNKVITPEMIARVLAGKVNGKYIVYPNTFQRIIVSMDKMIATRVTIDATEEAKLYLRGTKKQLTSFKYDSTLLDFEKYASVVDENNIVKYKYMSNELPCLYSYAERKKQLSTRKVQETKVIGMSATKCANELKTYLTSRINAMIHNENLERVILTQTILDSLNYKDLNKDQKYKLMKKIEKLLQSEVDKGTIKDYSWIDDGPTKREKKTKIQIALNNDSTGEN